MIDYSDGYLLLLVLILFSGSSDCRLCDNFIKTKGCGLQLFGHEDVGELCRVKSLPIDSVDCKDVKFGPIQTNTIIGDVHLKPYKMIFNQLEHLIVLNVTFTHIKWHFTKIRFQRMKDDALVNHCANITIPIKVSNDTVLHYDCFFSETDYVGQRFNLDFEATNHIVSLRGQYNFYMPSPEIFDPNILIKDWKPFIYVENLNYSMKLHVMPPPEHFKVEAYNILVKKACDPGTHCDPNPLKNVTTTEGINHTDEYTYTYSFPYEGGSYYFVVRAIHDNCDPLTCPQVESTRVIRDEPFNYSLVIGETIVISMILIGLVRYLPIICKRGKKPFEIKIFVIYSNKSEKHSNCVKSLVNILRDVGFIVFYDIDIRYREVNVNDWLRNAFDVCTHVMFISNPVLHVNDSGNPINIYEDQLQLLQTPGQSKILLNVHFEHSNKTVPSEMKHAPKFNVPRDMNKIVAFLTNTMWDKILARLPNIPVMTSEHMRNIDEESRELITLEENLQQQQEWDDSL